MNSSSSGIAAMSALVFGAVCLTFVVLFSGMPLNHDCALLLQCGEMILNGSVPYIDYVELNTHMAHYINIPPILLSMALGTALPGTYAAYVLVLTLLSSVLIYFLVRRTGPRHSPATASLAASSVVLLSLMAFKNGDFGQREHLFILAFMPYLLVRLARYGGKPVGIPTAVLTGAAAGIMVLVKVTFLPVFFITELWMVLRSKSFSALKAAEMLTICGVFILFGLHYLLLPWHAVTEFVGRWIPFIATHYDVYNSSYGDMIGWNASRLLLLVAGVASGVYLWRKPGSSFKAGTFTVALLSGAVVFFLQHKGWSYQLLPSLAFALMLLCLSAADWIGSRTPGGAERTRTVRSLPALCLGAAFLFYSGTSFTAAGRMYPGLNQFLAVIAENTERDDRIAFLTTDAYPKYPTLVYADRMPGTRFTILNAIAMVLEGRAGDDALHGSDGGPTPEEILLLEEVGSDILTLVPKLVIVQDSGECQGCPPGFSVRNYLVGNGWMDEYMDDYYLLEVIEGHNVYKRE